MCADGDDLPVRKVALATVCFIDAVHPGRREYPALRKIEGLAVEATEDFDLATWMEQTRGLLADLSDRAR
jgi:hypothetical protein